MALKLYYSHGDLDYFKVVLLVEWLKVPADSFIRINGKWALNKVIRSLKLFRLGRPKGRIPSLRDNTVSKICVFYVPLKRHVFSKLTIGFQHI